MTFDLAIDDIIYEKNFSPFTVGGEDENGRIPLQAKANILPRIIDEILITFHYNEEANLAIHKLQHHLSIIGASFEVEYQAPSELVQRYRRSVTYSKYEFQPMTTTVKITKTGVPAGFFAKYSNVIYNVKAVFKSYDYTGFSILPMDGNSFNAIPKIVRSIPTCLYPVGLGVFYLDDTIHRPVSDLFRYLTNKESKRRAGLKSFED